MVRDLIVSLVDLTDPNPLSLGLTTNAVAIFLTSIMIIVKIIVKKQRRTSDRGRRLIIADQPDNETKRSLVRVCGFERNY